MSDTLRPDGRPAFCPRGHDLAYDNQAEPDGGVYAYCPTCQQVYAWNHSFRPGELLPVMISQDERPIDLPPLLDDESEDTDAVHGQH